MIMIGDQTYLNTVGYLINPSVYLYVSKGWSQFYYLLLILLVKIQFHITITGTMHNSITGTM